MKCVICKQNETNQKHHVCYDPPMVISICTNCHILIHKHGVGLGRIGKKESDAMGEIETETNLASPYFTIAETINGKLTIFQKEGHELLHLLRCPNGCESNNWTFFYSKKQDTYIIRCRLCGFDAKVKRTG